LVISRKSPTLYLVGRLRGAPFRHRKNFSKASSSLQMVRHDRDNFYAPSAFDRS
jgi:hypothetical protein